MDTKLKNRHKLGVLLVILMLLLAAAATVGLYPAMGKQASRYVGDSDYQDAQDRDRMENLAPQVMNCVYSLWMEEIEEREGHMMTPTQVFFPNMQQKLEENKNLTWAVTNDSGETYGMVSEENDDLQWRIQEIDDRGKSWKSNYQSLLPNMIYTMSETDGNILRNSTERTLSGHAAGYVSVRLSFDESGRMTVANAEGSEARKAEYLANALMRYDYQNPLEDSGSYDLVYMGIPFEGPKNVTYDFSFDGMLLGNYTVAYAPYDLFWSGAYQTVVYLICLAVILAAFLLPCAKSLGLGQAKVFRVPFEILIAAGLCWAIVVLGEMSAWLVYYSLDGTFPSILERMGLLPTAASALVCAGNMVYWFAAYAMLYWGIVSFRAVFSLGLIRYIKERTLFGRILRWLWRGCRRIYEEMKTVDWREPSTKVIRKLVVVNFLILAVISCFWVVGIFVLILYSIGLFFLMKKYWREMQGKYQILLDGINQIADGNLDVEIQEDLGIFEPFRAQIDKIRVGFKKAVDEEVKSQSMKTELITNVSHDLKTPLTAIITYVNLLKDEQITEEERNSYIQVLDQKSMRLKVLIEDLFEVSKANSRNVHLNLTDLDVVSLMKQVRLELDDKIGASQIEFKWNLPEEPVVLQLDSDKTYRIFENLLVNIVKYGMPGSRAYIDMDQTEHQVCISMKNISAVEISRNGVDVTERFVRGDKSRNTEGSGLGLAIAKSFTELQKGTLDVEIEADLFKVILTWPRR